ncbi:MAG: response regulator [Coleofasciculaceae cyanobacterium]
MKSLTDNSDFSAMFVPSSVRSRQAPIAIHELIFTGAELAMSIQKLVQEEFSGLLELKAQDISNQQWILYFHHGNLIGCAGGMHPLRRWFRQLSFYCPQLAIPREGLTILPYSSPASSQASAVIQEPHQFLCRNYDSFVQLVKQGKLRRGQMELTLTGHVTEILFDIIQTGEKTRYHSGLKLNYRRLPENTIYSNLVSLKFDQAWQKALQAWHTWQQAGLKEISPNQAPVIVQAKELRLQTSEAAYQNLKILVDGNRTFRDLAVTLQQHLSPLAQSILPYLNQGFMELREVKDLSYELKPSMTKNLESTPVAKTEATTSAQSIAPLIACIDDSRIDSQILNNILTEVGYRCINILDPVQALPLLLEDKPDLIFLDLVMPVTNGYEVCKQIRRVSAFKDTPVVIFSSNIVDRVRAKMVGSSGSLAKPIKQEHVLATLKKYLQKNTSLPSLQEKKD